ncbi:MAG: DUF3833 domain-containing protein [Sphingomonas bacterium]|nr:DUF3833 domain-containing protein [Sphingomonas bacterium]
MIRMLFLSLALAGCNVAAPAAPPTFDPLAFFTGPLHGEGTLKVMTRPSVTLRVESHGRPDGKGGVILDQTIREGSKPARQRRWLMRPTSPTTLTGTITDNPGPVNGRLDGDHLRLSYRMKGGLKAEQVLTIQPGGRSMINRMTVRKFGITVAHVNEVITKSD